MDRLSSGPFTKRKTQLGVSKEPPQSPGQRGWGIGWNEQGRHSILEDSAHVGYAGCDDGLPGGHVFEELERSLHNCRRDAGRIDDSHVRRAQQCCHIAVRHGPSEDHPVPKSRGGGTAPKLVSERPVSNQDELDRRHIFHKESDAFDDQINAMPRLKATSEHHRRNVTKAEATADVGTIVMAEKRMNVCPVGDD